MNKSSKKKYKLPINIWRNVSKSIVVKETKIKEQWDVIFHLLGKNFKE